MNFRGAVNLFQMRWVKPLPMQCNGCSGVVKTSPMFSNWWCQRTFRKQKDFQTRAAEKVAKTKASHGWNFYSAEAHMSNKHQSQSWERIAHKLRCRDLEIWIPPTAAKKLHKMRVFHLPSRWPIGSKEHIAIYSNFSLLQKIYQDKKNQRET